MHFPMKRLRKPIAIGLSALLMFSVLTGVMTMKSEADSAVRVFWNGEPLAGDVGGVLIENRTFVPLRALAEAMGALVEWHETERSVTLQFAGQEMTLWPKRAEIQVMGVLMPLAPAPQILEGRTYVPLRVVTEMLGAEVAWHNTTKTVYVSNGVFLPRLASYEHLQTILMNHSGYAYSKDLSRGSLDQPMAAPAMEGEAAPSNNAGGAADGSYSQTNVQVEGVDEADRVKTDGNFIYQIKDNQIVITRILPADQLEIFQTITYADQFYPQLMYLDGGKLIVIGQSYSYHSYDSGGGAAPPMADGDMSIMPRWGGEALTQWLVYEQQVDGTWSLTREAAMDGQYLTSRKIGDRLLVLSNRWLPVYRYLDQQEQPVPAPMFKDTANAGDAWSTIPYESIRYFPDSQESNLMFIAWMDLANPNESFELTSYLGSGQTVYVSHDNLYIAMTHYDHGDWMPQPMPEPMPMPMPMPTEEERSESMSGSGSSGSGTSSSGSAPTPSVDATPIDAGPPNSLSDDLAAPPPDDKPDQPDVVIEPMPMPTPINGPMPITTTTTEIHRFSLQDSGVRYVNRGEVPGTLLNQFAMDEYQNHLRVATTSGESWRTDANTSMNNVYVMNPAMQVIGAVEDLAPGERIYAVRFMGATGYIVTFRTVDPLFVIDLSNPSSPEVKGELKIPGFSNYLHPLDEHHLIGIGQDAVEVTLNDSWRNEPFVTAFNTGMKLSLFDVSNPEQPIEKFSYSLGDTGTYSEVLYNHKALLFSAAKGILAFPITIHEVPSGTPRTDKRGIPTYGQLSFSGGIVIEVDNETGFQERGRVTHFTSTFSESNYYNYDYRAMVERLLYVDDTLYAISQAHLSSHDLTNLQLIQKIDLPGYDPKNFR